MSKKKNTLTLGQFFQIQHDNPPPPFNEDFDPKAEERYRKVTESMQADDFYANHSREECKEEWRRRYDERKQYDVHNTAKV